MLAENVTVLASVSQQYLARTLGLYTMYFYTSGTRNVGRPINTLFTRVPFVHLSI